ncbi:MAG: hypothetical protein IPM46_10655 [Flavobacteriales bacterium]|nr:hypothetical protein [Flavobacteriales bacterium]
MKRRDALSALLLAVAIALGALREFLFVNLNYQLDFVLHKRTVSYAHSAFRRWAGDWDAEMLIRGKWLLSLAFIATTLFLTAGLARLRFGDHRLLRVTVVAFLTIGALAMLLQAVAARHPFAYPIAVQLLHALQYPIPLLLVWALSWRSPT